MPRAKKGVDYASINSQPTSDQKLDLINREIKRLQVPSITDALVNRNSGGQRMLERLDNASKEGIYDPDTDSYTDVKATWKLKKLKNENGSTPKPGDVVRVKYFKTARNPAKKKMGANDIEMLTRRGLGSHYERFHTKTLDANCCAEFDYPDASQLLTQFGIHYEHGYPLNTHPYRGNKTEWMEVIEDEPKEELVEQKTSQVKR